MKLPVKSDHHYKCYLQLITDPVGLDKWKVSSIKFLILIPRLTSCNILKCLTFCSCEVSSWLPVKFYFPLNFPVLIMLRKRNSWLDLVWHWCSMLFSFLTRATNFIYRSYECFLFQAMLNMYSCCQCKYAHRNDLLVLSQLLCTDLCYIQTGNTIPVLRRMTKRPSYEFPNNEILSSNMVMQNTYFSPFLISILDHFSIVPWEIIGNSVFNDHSVPLSDTLDCLWGYQGLRFSVSLRRALP